MRVDRVEKVDFFLYGEGIVVAASTNRPPARTREIVSTRPTFSTLLVPVSHYFGER